MRAARSREPSRDGSANVSTMTGPLAALLSPVDSVVGNSLLAPPATEVEGRIWRVGLPSSSLDAMVTFRAAASPLRTWPPIKMRMFPAPGVKL